MSKICPKCEVAHEKNGTFCSRKCSNSRTWTEEDKIKKSVAAKNSNRVKEANKRIRSVEEKERTKAAQIETWNKKLLNISWTDITLKRKRVILEQEGKCNHCGINEWNNKPLTLELEHKDGNNKNNERENLEAICPNCHSQTSTWRRPKKDSIKVSDEELSLAIEHTKNLHQALIAVGLVPKGDNYKRAHRLKYGPVT